MTIVLYFQYPNFNLLWLPVTCAIIQLIVILLAHFTISKKISFAKIALTLNLRK